MLTPIRKKAEIPIYSFEKHARLDKTHAIYSPHVLILEGIFALHDSRVLEMLDMKVIFLKQHPALNLTGSRFMLRQMQICVYREDVSLLIAPPV